MQNQETKGKDEFLFQLTNAVNNNYTITVDKGSIFYYRGHSASMKPKIVFEKDILPKGKHDDLSKHIVDREKILRLLLQILILVIVLLEKMGITT